MSETKKHRRPIGRSLMLAAAVALTACLATRAEDPAKPTSDRAAAARRAGEAAKPETLPAVITRAYDVRALLFDVPHFSDAPDFNLAQPGGGGGGNAFAGGQAGHNAGPTREQSAEQLLRLLHEIVTPDLWRENGGTVAAAKEVGGLLFVTHTADGHRQVDELLRAYGRRLYQPVRVRAHWVLTDRTSLERIMKPVAPPPADGPAVEPATPPLPGGATLEVDAAELARLPGASLKGEVQCGNGQRAWVLALESRPYVASVNAGAGDGAVYANGSISLAERGLLLDVHPAVDARTQTARVTIRPQWKNHRIDPGKGGRSEAAATRPAGDAGAKVAGNADVIAERLVELRTTAQVPLGKMVLVGGATLDPTGPALDPTLSDGPATRPADGAAKPQLYLFIEITAG